MDKKKLHLLGYYNYFKLTCIEYLTRLLQGIKKDIYFLISIKLEHYKQPIWLRTGTSDYACFHLIFIQEEFKEINSLIPSDIKLMIDCGSNVGYTIRYFAERREYLNFIGIEPDRSNFEIASKNTSHLKNVQLIQKAIWSHNTYLKVIQGDYGNGGKWALKVIECNEDEGIEALTINKIIEEFHQEKIFIKMDIEGSEKRVLKENTSWSQHISFLCVELHDFEAEIVYTSFYKNHNFINKGLIGEMHCLANPTK